MEEREERELTSPYSSPYSSPFSILPVFPLLP